MLSRINNPLSNTGQEEMKDGKENLWAVWYVSVLGNISFIYLSASGLYVNVVWIVFVGMLLHQVPLRSTHQFLRNVKLQR